MSGDSTMPPNPQLLIDGSKKAKRTIALDPNQ
jgi:hypothetical protein